MSHKPVIAVDLDDVLYPTAQHLADIVGEPLGIAIDAYHGDRRLREVVASKTGMSLNEAAALSRRAFLHEDFAVMKPFPAALEAIYELAATHDIVAVTARSNEIHATTRRVIERDFGNLIREVYFPNTERWSDEPIDKLPHLREVGAVWLIDDRLSHVEHLGELGIHGGLFGNYPWNQIDALPHGVVRLANWPEAVRAIRDGGVHSLS
ncbi:hypothetical protein HJC99_02220 [Candidatus Saccharibacteria bacterium]|nr:hypothetical protein [Candidatus Saccharibacteria bacterium]